MTPESRPRHRQPRRRLTATNSVVLALLRSPLLHHLLDRSVCELRFVSRRGGRQVTLPVMYAESPAGVVILVGGAEGKTWWRTFAQAHPVEIRLRGAWRTGTGQAIRFGEPGRAAAAESYARRYPDVPVDDADPLVVITTAAS